MRRRPAILSPAALIQTRKHLLARIHRRFATITETHAVGPLRLPFARIVDPDIVLDQIVEAEDRRERETGDRRDGNELHLPYWAELWDSAFGIGAEVVGSWQWGAAGKKTGSPRPTVLDLGCGMGFAGMVSAAMGANVLFADLEADALLFARLNSLVWADRVRTRRVNWQTDRLDEAFDLILGADVLYDRTQWEFLDAFFQSHLAPGGSVLLGEPGRQSGDLFPDWITPRGWRVLPAEQKVPSRDRPIRLFWMMRGRKNKAQP